MREGYQGVRIEKEHDYCDAKPRTGKGYDDNNNAKEDKKRMSEHFERTPGIFEPNVILQKQNAKLLLISAKNPPFSSTSTIHHRTWSLV